AEDSHRGRAHEDPGHPLAAGHGTPPRGTRRPRLHGAPRAMRPPVLTLADLAAQPARVDELAPEQARAMLAQLVTLQAPLLARALLAGGGRDPDELLTVDAAAQRLGLSEAWLYRHARTLPFTVHVGRQVRFSSRRLEGYIANHGNGRPGSA